MNTVQQVVILSAEKEGATSITNSCRSVQLEDSLTRHGFIFKKAKGIYKGRAEQSFVVVLDNSDFGNDFSRLQQIAFGYFDQESILYQDANQQAYLYYSNGTTEHLGKLIQVDTPYEGVKTGSYTIMDGKYYTTIKV